MSHQNNLDALTPSTGVTDITGVSPIEANGVSGIPQSGSVSISLDPTGFVVSITGTANQIAASSSTGAVTLSLTNGISLGSYQATTPPTGGALIPGNVSIGSSSLTPSAVLSLTSTTQGFLPPQMTTTQRNAISSPAAGLTIYSTTDHDVEFWNGSAWIGTTISGVISAQGTAPITVNGVSGSAQTGALTLAVNAATTTTVGVASFNATNFSVSGSGAVTSNNFTINTAAPLSGGGSITLGGTLNLSLTGSGYVSSITGTANQIAVSPTTGASVVSLTNGISIGTYQANTPPTGGILLPGPIVLGQTSTSTGASIAVTNTQAYGYLLLGTTTQGKISYGFFNEQTIVETGAFPIAGFVDETTYNVSTGITSPLAASFYSSVGFTGNLGTITNFYGFFFDGAGAGAGTITNAYGGYFTAPAVGTNKTALHADNASIGTYSGSTVPPSGGLIVSGKVGIGTSSPSYALDVVPNSNTDRFVAHVGNGILVGPGTNANVGSILVDTTLEPNFVGTLSSASAQIFVTPNFAPQAGCIINQAAGIWISGGSTAGAGTTTFGYGLVVLPPTYGSSCKIAAYLDNLSIGYTTTTPPTNGAIIVGITGMGTSAPVSNSMLTTAINSTQSTAINITGTGPTNANSTILFFGETLSCTSNVANIQEIEIDSVINVTATNTLSNYYAYRATMNGSTGTGTISNAYMFAAAGIASGSGTTTNFYGYYYDGSHLGTTITTAYGAYFSAPSAGTNKTALYADNGSIGYTATTPPTNGMIVSGQVGVGTNSPATGAILDLTSTTRGFLPPRNSSPVSNISSAADGMLAYNTSLKTMQMYNSSAGTWFNLNGWQFIGSATAAGVGSLSFTNSASLPLQNYQSWFVNIEYILPFTNNANLEIQVQQTGTPVVSGYKGGITTNAVSSTNTWTNLNATSAIDLGLYSNTVESSGWLIIQNTQGGTGCTWSGMVTTNGNVGIVAGSSNITTINGFTIMFSSGNINLLEVQIYGLYNS